ncbi:hypothetical protein JXR93_00865 [bacterium]|nr:hypothetical protein [bacterium]
MDKLNWIASAGGPLVFISDNIVKKWSGVLIRGEFLKNNIDVSNNFMDPDETDYGKACLVDDYLGVLTIDNENLLILGEEPLITTFLKSFNNQYIFVRCYYSDDDEEALDDYLQKLDLNEIHNWIESIMFEILSETQYLFDSAEYFDSLSQENLDFLKITVKKGIYKLFTSIYEPNSETKLIIHKFEKI